MNKVNGITHDRHLRNPSAESIVSLPLDTAHQGEYGIRHHHHVHSTETPTNFKIGHASNTLQPVLIHRHRKEIATYQHQQGITHRQGSISLDVVPQKLVNVYNTTKIRRIYSSAFVLYQIESPFNRFLYRSNSSAASFMAHATMERSSINPGGMKSGNMSIGVTT